MMYNWNIVCNTNIHYVQKYGYDILMNNIYTKKSVSLETLRIRETGMLPEAIYTCLRSICNAGIEYTKFNTTMTITT